MYCKFYPFFASHIVALKFLFECSSSSQNLLIKYFNARRDNMHCIVLRILVDMLILPARIHSNLILCYDALDSGIFSWPIDNGTKITRSQAIRRFSLILFGSLLYIVGNARDSIFFLMLVHPDNISV
jgi:hypothetical protein